LPEPELAAVDGDAVSRVDSRQPAAGTQSG
jgi:hypothetical protein